MAVDSKKHQLKPLYIAAIGASAGGLEALQRLIANLPRTIDNLALIVVQHLSPNYRSMLVQSLRSQTSLEVVEVKNAKQVSAKTIYVTPPDRDISIRNGRLFLTKPEKLQNPRPSINDLFAALAEDQRENAIGIILSGTGTDGAQGLKKIEENGGATIVQNPKTAKFNSMPLSAIEGSKVDFILAPEKIGEQLASITRQGEKKQRNTKKGSREKVFEEIIELLSHEKGTDFSNYKEQTLHRRIEKRLSELNYQSAAAYYKRLKKNKAEIEELYKMMLIGVTSFFRDPLVFKELKKYIEILIDRKIAPEPLRVWTPGCASGEEAYSIAITIDSLLRKKNRSIPVQIIATDINETALETARRGVYQKKELAQVPADIIDQYFTHRSNSLVEVTKPIRSMVLFSRHDLTHNPPFLKIDLIVCRNLLIYFNARLQDYVFPVFYSALNPNGYLLLGKSESVGHFSDLFNAVKRDAKIYQRKAGTPLRTIRYTPLALKETRERKIVPDFTIPEMVKETLYKIYEHPYVVVNDDLDIQEISGDISPYIALRQGQMNANLIKMANKDLRIELRSLIHRAIKENTEVISPVLKFDFYGLDRFVKMIVRPLLYTVSPNEFYLVVFEAQKNNPVEVAEEKPFAKNTDNKRVKNLELELEATKADLQGLVERLEDTNAQLQSLNEELQSTNEELKISNEELETGNEELQSANEEINIAYGELKTANEALEEQELLLRKSDLNLRALLSNTLQAFILLDKTYRIIAFNKIAIRLMHEIFNVKLMVDKDFSSFLKRQNLKAFASDFRLALAGKTIQSEREITDQTGNDHSFIFNFTPVQNANQKVESISLSILDISELRRTKSALAESTLLVESVFHTADVGLALVDTKGILIRVNEGFTSLLGYRPDELNGKPYLTIIPKALRREASILENGLFKKAVKNFEYTAISKKGALVNVFITNRLFTNAQGQQYLVKTLRDITEERRNHELLLRAERLMGMGSFDYDLVTKNFFCSEGIYEMAEVPRGFNFVEAGLEKFIAKSDFPGLKNEFKTLVKSRKSIDHEFGVRTAKGNALWVHAKFVPLVLKNKVVSINGTVVDISARRLAEREIDRLSSVAKYTNNGVIITDDKGKIEWVNPSFERIMGYPVTEVVGKKLEHFLQQVETNKETAKKIHLLLKNKNPVSEVLLNYTKSGAPIWINLDITHSEKKDGSSNFIGILTDLTELVKAKEAQKLQENLEQRQRLLETMAESFPDGFIGVLDQNLNYLFVGGSELKRLGHTASTMVGDKLFDQLSPDANLQAEPYLEQVFKGKNVHFEVKLGESIYGVSSLPLRLGGPEVIKALVVVQNVTERALVEAETMRSLHQQKELNELKSRFVTLASHEFRTPLGTILSSADLALRYHEMQDSGNVDKHLNRIKSSVRGLTEILNEFLSLSRIEDGAVQNNPVQFDVVEFCNELSEEVGTIKKTGQVINYHHEGDQTTVFSDRQHLKNILINLLSNAIKYSPENKPIRFTSSLKDGAAIFVVQDEGIGIPDSDKEHLFKTFFRAKNVANIQGTGMGLHIVKRYLDIMGGMINWESESGKGSTFRIELPQRSLAINPPST